MPDFITISLLLVGGLVAAAAATRWYERYAIQHGIVAKISGRTLHERVVPRGGGIAFGLIFVVLVTIGWFVGVVPTILLIALGGGGAAATAIGFFDDVYGLQPLPKLALHGLLGLGLLVALYTPIVEPALRDLSEPIRIVSLGAIWFVPLWFINMYNFIDGIDGMATIGAVYVCVAATLLLMLGNHPELGMIFGILGVSAAGFLIFNLPPARVFMGDAGSIFLGYVIACLVLVTVAKSQIGAWTWVAILSYFIGDTTTTTLCRMVLVSRWYGVHRSHAYQNLARITRSHAKVTYGIALFHVCWAFPLALWSAISPAWAPVAAGVALVPVVAWTVRFGPPLSSD